MKKQLQLFPFLPEDRQVGDIRITKTREEGSARKHFLFRQFEQEETSSDVHKSVTRQSN